MSREGFAKRTGSALHGLLAYTTFLLLTVTVMQRGDHDGYQATHLFFMPRSTWEMDAGRGMLYSEDHYAPSDLRDLTGLSDPDTASSDAGAGADRHLVPGPTVRRSTAVPDPSGNEIPVAATLDGPAPADGLVSVVEPRVIALHSQQDDPPTPPPRTLPFG
ncbi:MAG: hypothetical protein M3021_12405 [Actinomycetota bacterium]|nr:hypothetical protein [Actinomycetota bacterium]